MPRPIEGGQRYMPGLDGLRALAVLAVLAYHLEIGWAQGGLLGVGVFFTLSGYLITDLLLEEWVGGGIRLGKFWVRRARRLLPALFVVLVAVTAWVTVIDPSQLDSLRGMVAASVGYVSNWFLIFQDVPYADRFGPPSPLGHLWSLAIEEQFYIVWPFVLLLGLWLLKEPVRRSRIRLRMAAATLALAGISVWLMADLYHPGVDATRVYDGTDTRAFGLLIGAALAMVWPARRLTRSIAPSARRTLDAVGVVGLTAIAVLVWRTNYLSPFLYPTGLVLLSLATAGLVAALAHPATRIGRALGWQPLRWIGVRSYGIYLWHFPVIALTTPTPDPGFDLGRAAWQTAVTIALAALSWRYVEEPVRRGGLKGLWERARAGASRIASLPRLGWATATVGAAALVVAASGLAGVTPIESPRSLAESIPLGISGSSPPVPGNDGPVSAPSKPDPEPVEKPGPNPVENEAAHAKHTHAKPADAKPSHERHRDSPPQTSCRSVVHTGDSTSLGLVSDDYLPHGNDQIDNQFARVGAADSHMEIEAATSIVETLEGGENAEEVANRLIDGGYDGCWVIALGVNDSADVYVGSSVDLPARVERMMSAIGDQPVMWLTAKSLVGGGAYANDNMRRWNEALLDACGRYPNMRVYDWAADVKDEWFIEDGIHYTSDGYEARAHKIARALAAAFPAGSEARDPSCVVG